MSGKEAYQKYLLSGTWKTIRAQRLAADNDECVLCGENAQHVHHRRYPKKWGTETIKDLVSLCGKCHGKHHGNLQAESKPDDKEKISISEECCDLHFEEFDESVHGTNIGQMGALYIALRNIIYSEQEMNEIQTYENKKDIVDLNTKFKVMMHALGCKPNDGEF